MKELLPIQTWLLELLTLVNIDTSLDSWIYKSTALLLLLLLAYLSVKIVHVLIHKKISKLVFHSENNWDDKLREHGFFRRAGHLVPAILIFLLSPLLFTESVMLNTAIQKTMLVYMAIIMVWTGSAIFNTIEHVYNASELSRRAPITGFIQVAKLLLVIVAILLVVSNLLDKSPLLLLSGLGAITAILLLLFRDTILGFVAGIQIAANRMVNTGDWIELEKYGANGEVLEVGLTTVKVKNWDNTISTIPTYVLISDSVKNWRGMAESGGRRIKRSVLIDIQTIRFCDAQSLDKYKKIRYISEYVDSKINQLQLYNKTENIDEQDLLNARRLTNIGTLRAYIRAYISHHPMINQELTMMVRQLPPTETGLPLEIYCFSSDKNWVAYEGIQADIFDHVLAMLPIFDLRAYQRVSDKTQ